MVWNESSILNHLIFEGEIFYLRIITKAKNSEIGRPNIIYLHIVINKVIENKEIYSDTLALSCFLKNKTYCIIKYFKNLNDCFYAEVINMLNEHHYYVWGM